MWNEGTRQLGHDMINAYPEFAAGQAPEYFAETKYTPGEFIVGLVTDDGCGNMVQNIAGTGLDSYDFATDWDDYWDYFTGNLHGHIPLAAAGLDNLHHLWTERYKRGYDTLSAHDFIRQAQDWQADFVVGVHALIDEGTLPLSHQTFVRRLEHPAEIGYIPQYVQRLNFLQRGESAADIPNGAASDHSYGILYNNETADNLDIMRSRFIHELVHFYLDGLLSVDAIMDSGEHIALDAHIGMWEAPISTTVRENEQGFEWQGMVSRHMELNEGGTEFLAADIHRVVPELGRFASRGLYIGWHEMWRQMRRDGVDLRPFLGYKVTDQGYDLRTMDHRLRWYGAMVEEFDRTYVPLQHHRDVNYGWPALDKAVAKLTTESDIYDENPEIFRPLLQKPSRLLRMAENLGTRNSQRLHHSIRQAVIRPPIQ